MKNVHWKNEQILSNIHVQVILNTRNLSFQKYLSKLTTTSENISPYLTLFLAPGLTQTALHVVVVAVYDLIKICFQPQVLPYAFSLDKVVVQRVHFILIVSLWLSLNHFRKWLRFWSPPSFFATCFATCFATDLQPEWPNTSFYAPILASITGFHEISQCRVLLRWIKHHILYNIIWGRGSCSMMA